MLNKRYKVALFVSIVTIFGAGVYAFISAGGLVTVRGTVLTNHKYAEPPLYFTLSETKIDILYDNVGCASNERAGDLGFKLEPGQKVTVRGRYITFDKDGPSPRTFVAICTAPDESITVEK